MSASGDVQIRRVGFRTGTDAELTALHSVEIPVAAERGSHRMPEPAGAYLAFARSLPAHFHDHAWLAQAPDGAPVAAGFCWWNSAGDPRVMECDALVHRESRRQGIGSRRLAAIVRESRAAGRPLLTWSTYERAPAGEAFSRRLGARVARVSRASELVLADLDWPMIGRWTDAERARELGCRLELVDGVLPAELRADAVTLHRIMQTAPRDDLETGDTVVDTEFIAQFDQATAGTGQTQWTVFVRDPAGECVGGTEMLFEPWNPAAARQLSTGIDPAHRGLGLARWAKALVLERIRDERPEVLRIETENAFSNAAMLAINEALGFTVISTHTEWQANLDDLRSMRSM